MLTSGNHLPPICKRLAESSPSSTNCTRRAFSIVYGGHRWIYNVAGNMCFVVTWPAHRSHFNTQIERTVVHGGRCCLAPTLPILSRRIFVSQVQPRHHAPRLDPSIQQHQQQLHAPRLWPRRILSTPHPRVSGSLYRSTYCRCFTITENPAAVLLLCVSTFGWFVP